MSALKAIRLWHILLVFVVLAAWSSTLIPLGEGPDELPHFTVTRYILQQGRLPDTPEEHESFQPPLYYLLSAGLTFWADTRDFVSKANADYDPLVPDAPKTQLLHTRAEAFPYQSWALAWHVMRFFSILLGAVTISAIYATARRLTGERNVALVCAALVAFLPGFIFMSAVVNNDNLSAALAALLCWQIVSMILDDGQSRNDSAPGDGRARLLALGGLGLLLGLGLLSKTSMLAFVLTLFVALLVAARRHGWSRREWLRANLVVFAIAFAVSGWYFVRNVVLYGDWLAWPLVLAANAVRTQGLSLRELANLIARVYRSYWLEWIGISLEPVALVALVGFSLLALAGISRRALGVAFRTAARPMRDPWRLAVLAILSFHLALIFASWVRWTLTVLGTEQSRLFYPALSAIVLLLALGLAAFDRRLPWALATLLLVLALLMPWHYVAPTYAPAPRIAALPPSAQPISATFKDKIRLVGWQMTTTHARAGETIQIGLYWEALKDLTDDDWLKMQLLDAGDQMRWFKDGSPSAGRDSTDSWRRGERIAAWHRVVIPADIPSGAYRLTIGVHPFGRKNWFPIEEENMPIALGDQLILCEIVVE